MDPNTWQRAKIIIDAALKRPPAECESYVRAQCGDDEELFHLILELLGNYTQHSVFLESLPGPDEDPLSDLQPGTRIAQYTILDRLGRGGMGQVFLCGDRELGRKVALKCLVTSRDHAAEDRERILREAKAAAAINHPNIASVHHVIEHGERAFIVMEYVHGENLAAALKRGRLSIPRVVEIGRELASALAAAHAKGVIHRDLKPANVQIQSNGAVKILDFGVAKATFTASSASSGASTTMRAARGAFSVAHGGTLPYMSPEQLLGRPVDERSDIYSLGVVMFEMATGRRPFLAEEPAALARAQAEGAPEVWTIEPAVPRPLGDVIARALAVDVGERYQSAAAVDSALEGVLAPAADDGARRRTIVDYAARIAGTIVIVPLVLTFLGFLSSTAFNNTLGRFGPLADYGRHSWGDYLYYGYHSLIAPAIYLIVARIALTAVAFTIALLALVPPLGVLFGRIRNAWNAAAERLDLRDPAVLAQALATLAITAIVVVLVVFWHFIKAWSDWINSAPTGTFEPIYVENEVPRALYRITLTILVGVFVLGLLRVLKLRRRRHSEQGRGTVLVLGAAIAFMVVMLQLPHRILFRADFERVDLGPLHCYNIGESGDSMLVYCPQSAPPRNRVVKRSDPALHRVGVVESIFHRQPSTRSGF